MSDNLTQKYKEGPSHEESESHVEEEEDYEPESITKFRKDKIENRILMFSPPISDANIAIRYQTEDFITKILHDEINNIEFIWHVYQNIVHDCENIELVVNYYNNNFFDGNKDDFIEEYYDEATDSIRIEKLTTDFKYLVLFRFYPIVLVPHLDIDKWTCYIIHSRDTDPINQNNIAIRIPVKLIIPIIYKSIADIYYMNKCNMSQLVDAGELIITPEFYLNRPIERFLFHQDSS
jgi:hypothetical protein